MADDALSVHVEAVTSALERLVATAATALDAAAEVLASALRSGGRVLSAGNGGSAAEAQHLAGELVGRLSPTRERGPLAGLALTADTVGLTALANDYGYEQVFARQVAGLARAGDALVVLSTSGASANLVAAAEVARSLDVATVGLLGGTSRALHDACDVVLAVPSDDVQVIQECHLVLLHVLVEMVEQRLDPVTPPG